MNDYQKACRVDHAQVVDRDSATLPGWRAIGLTTDHSGLNKFRSKDDANFEMVVAKLRERATTAPEAIHNRMKEFSKDASNYTIVVRSNSP